MNPFESMQALADLWGKGAQAMASAYPQDVKAMADGMSEAFGAWSVPDNKGLEEARRAFEQSWSAAQDLSSSLTKGMQGSDGSGLLRSDRRGHAGADPRSARLDVGDERGRRGPPAHGGRATPCRSVERGASVRRGVQRLGQAAPAQLRAQQGHARCLDAGGRRLRQAAERKDRERRAAARLDAGVPDALGRDGQRGPAGDAAHRRLPGNPARGAEGLDRPQACPADHRRVLQRDVRLSHAGRARRRPQVRHRIAARAPRVEALHAPHDASIAGA